MFFTIDPETLHPKVAVGFETDRDPSGASSSISDFAPAEMRDLVSPHSPMFTDGKLLYFMSAESDMQEYREMISQLKRGTDEQLAAGTLSSEQQRIKVLK